MMQLARPINGQQVSNMVVLIAILIITINQQAIGSATQSNPANRAQWPQLPPLRTGSGSRFPSYTPKAAVINSTFTTERPLKSSDTGTTGGSVTPNKLPTTRNPNYEPINPTATVRIPFLLLVVSSPL